MTEETDPFELPKTLPDDVFYKSLQPSTETIEQAKDRKYPLNKLEHLQLNTAIRTGFDEGATWQASQPNPHRIKVSHLFELDDMYNSGKITHSRMVEILNEIAAGKHKERIEI
jgi:hypothetical protein